MGCAPELLDQALCIACNYPLRGLSSTRCPECGREFDPADPWTMETRRPVPQYQRWLVDPVGPWTWRLVYIGVGATLWGWAWLPGGYLVAIFGLLLIGANCAYRLFRAVAARVVAHRCRRRPVNIFGVGMRRFTPAILLLVMGVAMLLDPPLYLSLNVSRLIAGDSLYRMWAIDALPPGPLGPRFVGVLFVGRTHVSPAGIVLEVPLAGDVWYEPESRTWSVDRWRDQSGWNFWTQDFLLK
jgi:hypothetical protein